MTSSRTARARAAPTTRRRSRRTERIPKINDIVDIWWAVDKTFYRGRLTRQYQSATAFRILYDDGETEDIDLVNEYWKFADDDKPAPPPRNEDIVDVVLDTSDHHQQLDTKPKSSAKKTKQKPTKPAAKPKTLQASDDERDKDYVEEERTPETTTRMKAAKGDVDKTKKRPKKTRRQTTTSDKTSSASRPPHKTTSDSRRAGRLGSDNPDSTSQLSPQDQHNDKETVQAQPDSTTLRPQNVALGHTDSKQTPIFREGTNSVSKNVTEIVDGTPAPLPAPNARPPFHSETHHGKSQNTSRLGKSKTGTSEIVQSRTAATGGSQPPTTSRSTGSQRLTETIATSRQQVTAQNAPIISQRDLATIQAEPSLLPPDRQAFPSPSDASASARHTVTNNDAATSFGEYKQVSTIGLPSASAPSPAIPSNKDGASGEMVQDVQGDERPLSASVPVKVAIRPRVDQGNLSGSGITNSSRGHGETSTDHSGIAEDVDMAEALGDSTVGKRSREECELVPDIADARANSDIRPKRSKAISIERGVTPSDQPDGVTPLTHFPEHDPTLATLVNRRLNPIERHLRAISEDLSLLTSSVEAQRKISQAITATLRHLQQDMRKEIRAMHEEITSVQADKHQKQHEILKLLGEMKDGLAKVSASQSMAQTAGPPAGLHHGAPNGINVRSPHGQRGMAPQSSPSSLPQAVQHRDPLQVVRPVRGTPPRDTVPSPDSVNTNDDANVSPRRVAAPLQNTSRPPANLNATKVNQLPSGLKNRITNVVARQITVWLLETPHEYNSSEGISLDAWARRTSAGAFERVADRLSHFDGYTQAYQTLTTSLGNDAVEMSWFTSPDEPTNVMRARRNYAAWDPPPSDSEWESEAVLLTEIAKGFRRALEHHIWRNEDDLVAAVVITRNAAAWYGMARTIPPRQSNNTSHIAISQAHHTGLPVHQNGAQFVRNSR